MKNGLPFVTLWSEARSTGEVLLHLLNREVHHTVLLPKIGTNANAVEEFLPELVLAIPALQPHARWLLLLEPTLPEPWFGLRWESLNLAGLPLSSQSLVVRDARWGNEQPASANGTAWLLNLFPQEEFSFLVRLQPHIQSGRLRTCRNSALNRVAGADDLFLLAHGRANGVVDTDDLPFALPPIYPAPRRIWLLACNIDGALDPLAQNLLKCGCDTVIAGTSELSAPAMADLIEDWILHGREFGDVASWLTQKEAEGHGNGDIHALTIWGGISIDQTPCARWNRLTWDDAHGDPRRPPLDDETSFGQFQEAHRHAMSPQAWPLTHKWMLPPLLWLAEKHHHPVMRELSEAIGDTDSPEGIRGLAAAARRVGNYVQTARYLSLGLNLPDLLAKERAEYLGALANLFIDLDLPESAAVAIELHEDCNLNDPKDRNEADFKRLDWRSRMEARRGRLDIALDLMTTKRKRTMVDDGRELAWQLYLSSWGYIAGQVSENTAASFATEVAEQLSKKIPQEVGYGNETVAYLLRSLAVHSWALNDSQEIRIVERWLVYAENRLTDDDPGPWAYTIAFLYFRQTAPSPSFERAMSALENSRYYFEAASLLCLADNQNDGSKLLARFQRRRKAILAELTDNLDILASKASEESMSRMKAEIDFRSASIARHGTLPL